MIGTTPLGVTPRGSALSALRRASPRLPRGGLGLAQQTPSASCLGVRLAKTNLFIQVARAVRVAATPDSKSEQAQEGDAETKEAAQDDDKTKKGTTIYGTSILVEDVILDFSNFLHVFIPRRAEASDLSEAYYLRAVRAAASGNGGHGGALDVNCRHLHQHSPDLYTNLVEYPQEMIPIFDVVIDEEVEHMGLLAPDEGDGLGPQPPKVKVRPYNLRQLHDIRELEPDHINRLVAISGMITRTSSIIPELRQAHYRCCICGGGVDVAVDRGRIDEPSRCPVAGCASVGSMELVHNRSLFIDKQIARLQEKPDSMPAGHAPSTTSLFAFEDLVDFVRPGDRVEVTGIYRAIPRRVNPRVTTIHTVFGTCIDVVHYRVEGNERDDPAAEVIIDDSKPTDDDDPRTQVSFSRDRIEAFHAFAEDRDRTGVSTYERLLKCIAPSIFGLEDVKRGVLCMLFGGVARIRKLRDENETGVHYHDDRVQELEDIDETGRSAKRRRISEDDDEGRRKEPPAIAKSRGDINILLCGDPGTSKSQLLRFVHSIAPRGVFTSGKGSSAVGLTAAVSRDPETRELVMESGAVVLSDLGICCFPADDHQLLTNRGFLSLDDVLQCRDRNLQFASYDPVTKHIRYEHARHVVVKPGSYEERTVVELTDHRDKFRWCSSDPYGRPKFQLDQGTAARQDDLDRDEDALEQLRLDSRSGEGHRSTQVSIVATLDHDIYAMLGHAHKTRSKETFSGRFEKYAAGTLAAFEESVCFKLLAHAECGICMPNKSDARCIMSQLLALGLENEKQVIAFLELYGFWLGNGSLCFSHCGAQRALTFHPTTESDFEFLVERLRICRVDEAYIRRALERRLHVFEPRWVRFFFYEYASQCAPPDMCERSANDKATVHKKQSANRDEINAKVPRPASVDVSETTRDLSHSYHASSLTASGNAHTTAQTSTRVQKQPCATCDALFEFWRFRAFSELPSDIVDAVTPFELCHLLKKALSKSSNNFVLEHIKAKYRGAVEQSLLHFFSIVIQTAHLPFLRPCHASGELKNSNAHDAPVCSAIRLQSDEGGGLFGSDLVENPLRRKGYAFSRSPINYSQVRPIAMRPVRSNESASSFGPGAECAVGARRRTALCETNLDERERISALHEVHVANTWLGGSLDDLTAGRRDVFRLDVPASYVPEKSTQFKTVLDVKSAKWVVWWALKLAKTRARAIIHGYGIAHGSRAIKKHSLYTASPTLRDQLVVLAMHAGYCARFELQRSSGTIDVNNVEIGNTGITPCHNMWAVSYADGRDDSLGGVNNDATPTLFKAKDVATTRYCGRTWCVSVPSTFIIVRRVKKANGIVTCASVPTIQGNCIDEFDKMNDATRAVLHEAMEQQTISLAKAGIVATLNARTSILASANPIHSMYDTKLSVIENIQLPPTLLSRFDLIYLILDHPDREADRRLARHLVSLYYKDPVLPKTDVDERFLRDYVKYARARIMPEIDQAARDELVESYVRLRGGGSLRANIRRSKAIPATPRQLEGMIRISEALARMRLEETVQKADVLEAVRLVQVATLAAATDKSTGLVDLSSIATGHSANERGKLEQLTIALRRLIEARPRGEAIPIAEIRSSLQEQSDEQIDQQLLFRALKDLADDDLVTHSSRNSTITRR